MSTLQVANVWLESTANNRIQMGASNNYVFVAGGANTLTVNSTVVGIGTFTAAANGYTYLPNGLIMQWFTAAVTNAAAQTLNFPTAFPTNCYSVSSVPNSTAQTASQNIKITIANGTSITANCIGSNTSWYFTAIGN